MEADGQADEIRRLKKEAGKLKLKLAISEQARERIEHHLDKNNSLFKANILELDAAFAALERQIVECKRAEDVKQEALSRLQKIASLVPGVIYQFRLHPDGSSCVPYASEAIRDIYRLSPEEVREDASKAFAVVHPEDLDAHLASIQESARDLTPWKQEYRLKFGDEPERWLFGNAIPQREADGSTLWHGFITDITDRRVVEEVTPDIFYVIDLQGNLTRWNRSLETFCGLPPERMKGRSCLDFVCDEDRPIVVEDIQKVLTKGSAVNTYRFIRRDGVLVPFHCNGTLILNARGEPSGFAGFGRDISELQEKERLLRDAKNLAESATKLKDQFVALVAHDLRSPLASMLGMLRVLAERKPTFEDEKSQKLLHLGLKSADRMITMIDQLLQISRLQTGKITPHPRFFKGHIAVEATIQSLSHNAAQKGIGIINDVPVDMRLYADQSLFDEVLNNLLSNAIKFCSSGDKITFFTPPGLKSAIAVRDTGKGINEKSISNLFKHEMQTSTPGTDGELGTGLGLPFSYDIMVAHGGDITVESAPGEGSVFCATLPHVKPIALIVEDDSLALMALGSFLGKIGIDVIETLNGEQALAALKDKRPHIIITDINMPGMDGFTLLGRLKNNSATSGIPVIVMTSAEGETREKAFRYGADDFVGKPLMLEEFIPRVRRFVG